MKPTNKYKAIAQQAVTKSGPALANSSDPGPSPIQQQSPSTERDQPNINIELVELNARYKDACVFSLHILNKAVKALGQLPESNAAHHIECMLGDVRDLLINAVGKRNS